MAKWLMVALCALACMAGCRQDFAPRELGNPAASRRVLIAGSASEFKEAVVARVIEELGIQGHYFRLIGLDRLSQEDLTGYGAVLLVCDYRAGRIDSRVRGFLDSDPTDPRVVLFYTVGSENPKPESARPDFGVDAVTSASAQDRARAVADRVAALVEERLVSR